MLFRLMRLLRAKFGPRSTPGDHNPEAAYECGRLRAYRLIYFMPR